MSSALTVKEEKDAAGVHVLKILPMDVPVLEPGCDDVLVDVSCGALNRRDHWIRRDLYPALAFPWIMGADCCGVVSAVGKPADHGELVGKRVILDAAIGWGPHTDVPSPTMHIFGSFPAQGTFASVVRTPAANVYPAPSHLTDEQAAALPLAGLTAYRAVVTRGAVRRGDVVLVSGVGGGVAVFALQYAVALGASVYVTSSSQAKVNRAIALGAKGGVLYTDDNWSKSLKAILPRPEVDVVIDGAGGASVNSYIDLIALGGRIVCYGATSGRVPSLHIHKLFLKNASLVGSTMGSPHEFQQMLDLVNTHKIVPEVDHVFPLRDYEAAFEALSKSSQFGKVVLRMPPRSKL